jgi:hypothetical protein
VVSSERLLVNSAKELLALIFHAVDVVFDGAGKIFVRLLLQASELVQSVVALFIQFGLSIYCR